VLSGGNPMKVGDLVMLSAAGRARNGNWRCRDGFGFVNKIKTPGGQFPIQCQWWAEDMRTFKQPFKAYELKKFKKTDKK
jgi:hypothetical protein